MARQASTALQARQSVTAAGKESRRRCRSATPQNSEAPDQSHCSLFPVHHALQIRVCHITHCKGKPNCAFRHNGGVPRVPSDQIRDAIENARRKTGLGTRKLEALTGLKPWSLRGLLAEDRRVPSVDRAAEICRALGLELRIGPPRSADSAGAPDRAATEPAKPPAPSWTDIQRRLIEVATRAEVLRRQKDLPPATAEQVKLVHEVLEGLLRGIADRSLPPSLRPREPR